MAANDSYTTAEDTPLTAPAPGVLANDSDADGDTLTATLVSGPAHGTLALNANGSFTYTPAANYCGPDSFTYTLGDGHGGSDTATVSITVVCVNDPPDAVADSYTTNQDTAKTVAHYFRAQPDDVLAAMKKFKYFGAGGWGDHMKLHTDQMEFLTKWLHDNGKISNLPDVKKWENISFIPK